MVYYYSIQKSIWEFTTPKKDVCPISIEEIKEKVNKHTTICIDCETTGLDPLVDKIIMVQFGTGEDQYVIDTRGLDFSKHFKTLLEDKNKLFVGHNIKFDYNMLKQYGIILSRVYDTMLADRVVYNGKYTPAYIMANKRFSLAGVYEHYFHSYIPKTVRNEFVYWGENPFTKDQVVYGAKDVEYPLQIKAVQSFWVNKYSLQKAVDLENKSVLSVGDIEYNGFYVDTAKWLKAYSHHKKRLAEITRELDDVLINKNSKYKIKAVQLSLFGTLENSRGTDVNWDSPIQVQYILNNVFGIYPEDKDGKKSTSTKALLLLIEKPDIVLKLLEYRKSSKVVSSFGKKFLDKHLGVDRRLHSHFNQMVDTGRMSSRNPNMQQIPKGDMFRGAFVAPKGKLLITADYSNQEGRIMADFSNDTDYIDFFNNGDGDAHSFVATKMFSAAFGKEFIVTSTNENKDYRQKGKTLNFMISFGGSAFTLSKDLKIPIEEAEGLIDSFYLGFPGLKKMFTANKRSAIKDGFIRTNKITNRIRWIPEWDEYSKYNSKSHKELSQEEMSLKGKLKGRIERKGMNTPIQGTAGDMTKTALVIIRDKLLELGINPLKDACIKIVQVVHDEIVLEATELMAQKAAEILKYAMEKAGTYYVKSVAMSADPVIGPVWDH